jgi:hypothetical protein
VTQWCPDNFIDVHPGQPAFLPCTYDPNHEVPSTHPCSPYSTSGYVSLDPHRFALVDGDGQVYLPNTFTRPGVPMTAPAGRNVIFQRTEQMAVGAGSIRWVPDRRVSLLVP